MPVEITLYNISKLESRFAEIQCRALDTIEEKLRDARIDLDDLIIVDLESLIKSLLNLMRCKQQTDYECRVLNILLKILNSKFRWDAKKILEKKNYRSDLNRLQLESSEMASSKRLLGEIFDILNAYDGDDRPNSSKFSAVSARYLDHRMNGNDTAATDDRAHSYLFTSAWETPSKSDANTLEMLNESLQADVDSANIEHALHYFGVIVNDYLGEYFLQSPHIFTSLLRLMDAADDAVNKVHLLNCCSQLTKNLDRRVTVRRLAKTYYCKPTTATVAAPAKQVTIGTYCYETFCAVLRYLQEIYATNKLENINFCFVILIEVIELVCTAAGVYSLAVANDYRIARILQELGVFLKFIRESSENYSHNLNEINRNNSISIIYLLCRLLMFKENDGTEDETESLCATARDKLLINAKHSEYDANRFASSFNHDQTGNTNNDTTSFVSALDETGEDDMHRAMASKPIWICELEIALLDFALKEFYPDVHDLVAIALKLDSNKSTNQIKVLLNIPENFRAAVKLLKEPKQCTDEMYVRNGLDTIDVLPLLQSDELVQNLFNAISNLSPQYDHNESLRTCAERLLLRLFGHECMQLKQLVYRLTAEKIGHHFSCIMDGTTMIAKSYLARIGRSHFFSVPLTVEILIEIICDGLTTDTDNRVHLHAESILTLILRCRKMMPEHWSHISEFLIPTLPLLMCFAGKNSKLGSLIFRLTEPSDENRLPSLRLFQSNVVLLFSRDDSIRDEASYRLSFMLQKNELAANYLPNINFYNDIVPNNLCVVDAFVNPEWHNVTDLYEASYVQPMIELLNAADVEPSIRRTTLVQLNVMLQDASVARHFYDTDGMLHVLRIFDESLRNDVTMLNYADNVIPIVGILAKLCMHFASARQRLALDEKTYILLLRAQLLFYDSQTFKADCAIVLFSMAFNEYIVGGCRGQRPPPPMSIPSICKKLLVPLKCDYHRLQSSCESRSAIEMLLLSSNQRPPFASSSSSRHIESAYDKSVLWRFVRMCFASSWFGSLTNLPECPDKKSVVAVNYFPAKHHKSIAFNAKLCLTRDDVEVINCTSPSRGIAHWLNVLRNATTYESVSLACAAIENYSNIDSVNQKKWDSNTFQNAIRRFCAVMPQGEAEEHVYRNVLRLLSSLIEREFRDVHLWVLSKFQNENCIFLQMLSSPPSASSQLFDSNAQFLEIVLTKTFQLQAKKSIDYLLHASPDTNQKNASRASNLFEKLFVMVTSQLDDTYGKRSAGIDTLRSLVSLLRTITSSVHLTVDDYTASYLVNKLLKFIKAFTPYAQTGSQFNKNCLLTIGNLMIKIEQLKIESKYVKLLSGLCSHRDYEMRAYAWSVLTKLSTTLNGAEQMIHELSNLPGGFHACCLSTLLDASEPAIVRENAAYVFSTLISYRQNGGQLLHDHVLPMCWDNGNQVRNEDHLDMLLRQHKLFKRIALSLDHFDAAETIVRYEVQHENFNDPLTSTDLLRSFCVILCNLLTLRATAHVDLVYSTMCKIITVIPHVAKCINKSSVLLLTEICTLTVHCMHQKRQLIDHVARESRIVSALVSVLNIDLFEEIPKSAKHECWSEVLTVLKWLCRSSVGFCAICDAFEQNIDSLSNTFNVLTYGLAVKDTRIPVLRILTNLLVVSQSNEFNFRTFADSLNGLTINAKMESSADRLVTDGHIKSQSIVNLIDDSSGENERFAVDILYRLLVGLFVQPSANIETKVHENVCKTLEALLKCSTRIRYIATEEKFSLQVIEQMGKVVDSIGGSWAEYVRRHGNAKIEKYAVKLKLLFNMIISWYSCDCLEDLECIQSLVKMCIRLWPCLGFHFETHTRFMKMLLFLSDDSLPVCKAMATISATSAGGANQNLLQTIVDYCVNETNKAKNAQANLTILELGLRISSNCCSCIEGRLLINKANMLYTLGRLHPQVTRGQKPWPQVTLYWLKFCETLTRHTDRSSVVKHLSLLRMLTDGNVSQLRQLALQILRNMAFNAANRSVMLTSDDFIHVVYTVLEKGTPNEQLIVVTSIWKLIAQNSKGKNTIKNSKIYHRLRTLQDELGTTASTMAKMSARNNGAMSNKNHTNDDEDGSQPAEEILDDLRNAVGHTLGILQG